MKLIDTHCHLYSEEFKEDIDNIIIRAEIEGITKMYLPAIDSESHTAIINLTERYPSKCIAMMGLHPCYVKENFENELLMVKHWLTTKSCVAIGEIGLDFYHDSSFAEQQYKAFRTQMEWAILYDKPIVIHTRNAMQETINMVKEFVPQGIRGIFHCFSGSYESAQEIIKAGFYLGIGGVLTYKNSGLAEVLKKIDLKHLVLETDAPYLSPVPFRGKRNESSYLKYIAAKLAEVKAVTIEEVAAATTANAEKIFGL